jgi:thioredoxin 1
MTEEKKNLQGNNTILVIIGVVVLLCIVGFSWNKTKVSKATDTTTTIAADTADEEAIAGKMGVNEISITADNFVKEVEQADKLVLVDAFLPTCPHCQDYSPNFTAAADEYVGKAIFGKMDLSVSANNEFASGKDISSVPCTLIYKDGVEVKRLVGSKTADELKTEIDALL